MRQVGVCALTAMKSTSETHVCDTLEVQTRMRIPSVTRSREATGRFCAFFRVQPQQRTTELHLHHTTLSAVLPLHSSLLLVWSCFSSKGGNRMLGAPSQCWDATRHLLTVCPLTPPYSPPLPLFLIWVRLVRSCKTAMRMWCNTSRRRSRLRSAPLTRYGNPATFATTQGIQP